MLSLHPELHMNKYKLLYKRNYNYVIMWYDYLEIIYHFALHYNVCLRDVNLHRYELRNACFQMLMRDLVENWWIIWKSLSLSVETLLCKLCHRTSSLFFYANQHQVWDIIMKLADCWFERYISVWIWYAERINRHGASIDTHTKMIPCVNQDCRMFTKSYVYLNASRHSMFTDLVS